MDRENNSSELKNVGQAPRLEITLDIGKLSLSQSELCEIYHHVPQVLLKNAIKVNVAEHNPIQYSRAYEVLIAEERNGNYWVIAAEDRTQWLFPKVNFKINPYNLDRVKSLFECQGDKPENTREFFVKKPARLSIIAVGSQWTLEEKGILEFGNNSILSKLKSELEQEKEECGRLQSQLKPLMQEQTEIQSQLDRSKSERSLLIAQVQQLNQERSRLLFELEQADKREQDILSQLVTRDEFQKQMQQATKERKLLVSLIKEVKQNIQVSSEQSYQLVVNYNQNTRDFLKSAIVVSETEESINNRRLGNSQPVVLEESRKGNYCIIKDAGVNYMVPKENLKINQYNYNTVEVLFECPGYQSGYSSNFRLVKPASVSPTSGNKWLLIERGILEFSSSSNDLNVSLQNELPVIGQKLESLLISKKET